MIIGNGLLAQELKKFNISDDYVLFASGVSNSTEDRLSEFEREFDLLRKTVELYPDKVLVYFSTCSIYNYTQ